jgi:hypothetical protein
MITGRLFCRETVRKVLRQLGHSWKKARKLLGKACPTRRAEFVEQLCQLLTQSKEPDAPLVLFCDEAHIHLDTDLGYGWTQASRCSSGRPAGPTGRLLAKCSDGCA